MLEKCVKGNTCTMQSFILAAITTEEKSTSMRIVDKIGVRKDERKVELLYLTLLYVEWILDTYFVIFQG